MGYRTYSTANGFIVAQDGSGDFTTIAAAIAAATAGDTIFIKEGTYTENLTLKASVNLSSFSGGEDSQTTTIVGKLFFSAEGHVDVSNLRLETNNDFILELSGSAASVVSFDDVILVGSNNSLISYTSSSSSSGLNIRRSSAVLNTTGINYFTHSSAGFFGISYSSFGNPGGSSTASTASAGTLVITHSSISAPITTSSTCTFNSYFTRHALNNATVLTLGSTENGIFQCYINSGTASAVSVGGTAVIANCDINSSATNAVTGAGSVTYSLISFRGTSSLVNTTTQTRQRISTGGISFDGGTNNLTHYSEGTFTPTLQNSGAAPTVTYSAQAGTWTRCGRVIDCSARMVLTAYTAGTGVLRVPVPFTAAAESGMITTGTFQLAMVTFFSGVSWITPSLTNNTNVATFIGSRSNNSFAVSEANQASATSTIIYSIAYHV
jgi:hypothetical protein